MVEQERAINMQSVTSAQQVGIERTAATHQGIANQKQALADGFISQQAIVTSGSAAVAEADKGSWVQRIVATAKGAMEQAQAQQSGVNVQKAIQDAGITTSEQSENESFARRVDAMETFVDHRTFMHETVLKSLEMQVTTSNKIRQQDIKNLNSYLKAVTQAEHQTYQVRMNVLHTSLTQMASLRNTYFNIEMQSTIAHHRSVESEFARHVSTLSTYASQASKYATSVTKAMSSATAANNTLSSVTAKSALASKQFSTVSANRDQPITFSIFGKSIGDTSTLTAKTTTWR
jgi:hypothetical protein